MEGLGPSSQPSLKKAEDRLNDFIRVAGVRGWHRDGCAFRELAFAGSAWISRHMPKVLAPAHSAYLNAMSAGICVLDFPRMNEFM